MKKKQYNVRWHDASCSTRANVSFEASHDANAKKQADKIGKELGVSSLTRTLYEGNRSVD